MTDFIAEICSNHNGDLGRALKLIDTAADIGCSGVKFQLFRLDKLFAPEALSHPDYQHLHKRREWELPLDWLPVLSARCKERGIKFGCTPFHLEAVEQLAPFVDFYKIASYNVLDHRLIEAVAKEGKPVLLSTGMATREEVRVARKNLVACKNVIFLHCVSQYPTPLTHCNPRFLYQLFEGVVSASWVRTHLGWSDHTVSEAAIYYFASLVNTVEFHLDLDKRGNEYNLGHCWLPNNIGKVIKTVAEMDLIGDLPINNKGYTHFEEQERLWRADPADGLRPVREIRGMLGDR